MRTAVSHPRDAQGVLAGRLELILAQAQPVADRVGRSSHWAQNEANQPPSTRQIFAEYMMEREKLLARLKTLPLIDWWRTDKHEEFGTVTIRQQVSYFAAYELTHLAQIEQLVIAGP